ncbi:MAG: RQC domain-containing protein, partial [Burkholderiaceae bacterium]
LSCIYRCQRGSGFGFAATHIIDVLRGKQTEKVAKFGHEQLSTFGIGTELSEAEWRLLLRHLVAQHVVEVDHATFNVLRLTDASRAVLRGERTIELRHQIAPLRRRPAKQRATGTASDDPLFEKLRVWRAQVAREHGVPAFVVFHDGTLRAIAQVQPRSLGQLRTISGIGEKKLASYGEGLLALLASGP